MLIKLKAVWHGMSSAMRLWQMQEAARQSNLLNTTSLRERSNELPDRGRDNETKTVAGPHSKPVQE